MFEEEEGPRLAAALGSMDLTAADDRLLVDAVAGWERLAAWAAAGQLAALAELARRRRPVAADAPGGDRGHPGLPTVSEFAVDEVAAVLRLSRQAAGTRLHVAVDVAERLPGTGAALRRGELDLLKVRRIVEATAPLPAAVAARVEQRVLPRAGSQTVGQLRASLSRAVLAVDPADAEERHRRAMADRRVCLTPREDGMAELWALLPADGAAAVRHALDVLADRSPGGRDGRTMDNRRADALIEMAVRAVRRSRGDGGPRWDGPGGRAAGGAGGGARPEVGVHLTVPAGTLLGLSDEPGELAGHGPIPASLARRLAADGTWRRILTDPASGAVLDVGRRSYAPPAALVDHVVARDRTCRFPGCRLPARRCDLDHTVPYPAGPTSAGNLAALCRHHHRLKHLAGWQVEQPEPGVLVWTSPAGHRYRTEPPAA